MFLHFKILFLEFPQPGDTSDVNCTAVPTAFRRDVVWLPNQNVHSDELNSTEHQKAGMYTCVYFLGGGALGVPAPLPRVKAGGGEKEGAAEEEGAAQTVTKEKRAVKLCFKNLF